MDFFITVILSFIHLLLGHAYDGGMTTIDLHRDLSHFAGAQRYGMAL